MDVDEIIRQLDGLLAAGRNGEVEKAARAMLARKRVYVWHLYLIVALLRSGRRAEAGRELDDLFSYKFNIADRAWPEVKQAFPEKFGAHYILSTMKPELGYEAGARVRHRWDVPSPMADREAFAGAVDVMLAEAMPTLPLLAQADTHVTTFGSCFAANLARLLKQAGVDATNLLIEESINSPHANQAFLHALADPARAAHAARIEAAFGAGFIERARAQIAGARVIVLTLGVAPSFFHADSGAFAFLEDYRTLLAAGRVVMRTPPVEEVKAIVADGLRTLRAINPGARLYVTISPVPLMGTAELANAVLADCVSKTTLRAALHEVLQAAPIADVHYWPSFEIVRWLGAHTPLAIFGADDNVSRHVSEWAVQLIVDRFSRHLFGAPAPEAAIPAVAAAPGRSPTSR